MPEEHPLCSASQGESMPEQAQHFARLHHNLHTSSAACQTLPLPRESGLEMQFNASGKCSLGTAAGGLPV